MAASEARFASGKRTRIVYARSFAITGVAAGSPSRMAVGISCNFFGRKSRARGDGRIHLEDRGGTTDRVFNAVLQIDHA